MTIPALFDAGLDILALDDYQGIAIVGKVRDNQMAIAEKLTAKGYHFLICEYPSDARGNPHRRQEKGFKLISLMRDISIADKGTHSNLNNHAGAAAPPSPVAQGKRCAKPFRELSVRWNGNVAICCNDWRGVYKCGNIVRDGLLAVWNSEEMDAARRHLIRGERVFAPCKGCDALSYRVGLLPDPLGKEDMPLPNSGTAAIIAEALKGDSYATPVKREWEQ